MAPRSVSHGYHTLVVLVENKPGVLARVSSLFARRGYNIHSLTVAPTEDDRLSRITIVADTESAPLEQITKQLYKLINVVKINELAPGDAIERELLLATVKATPHEGPRVGELPQICGRKVRKGAARELRVPRAGPRSNLDICGELLRSWGTSSTPRAAGGASPRLDRSAPAPGL